MPGVGRCGKPKKRLRLKKGVVNPDLVLYPIETAILQQRLRQSHPAIMPNEPEQRANFDSPWKDILTNYFEDFIAFFFPQAYSAIDWSKPYQFLDTELQQIVRDAELGKRIADKLVQVWLKNGDSLWVLIHIEIQNQPQTDFAKRMYTYNHRIFDRYDR